MNIILENCTENQSAWLELKKNRIGSSQIGTVCGMSRFKTPLELWAEMTGKVPPDAENDFMWLGTKMEPILGELFTRKRGIAVRKPDVLIAHPEKDWAIATPDFFTIPITEGEAPEIVEAKNSGARSARFWMDGDAPVDYQLQLQWQLGVCALTRGYIAGLVGGNPDDFYNLPYEFDPELFDTCMTEAEIFIELVRQDVPPVAGPGDSKLIARLQGVRAEETTILTEDALPTVDEYLEWSAKKAVLHKEIRDVDDECDRLKGRILQLVGNKTAARLPDGRLITAKTTHVKERVQNGYSYVNVRIKNDL